MKSTISNVPYSEVLSLEEKKKLEAQLKEVEILDLDKSMQAYISAQLTDSEMRTFKKLEDDYSARGKINRLAAEFNELEFIPEQCRVKDIRETPIAKSLITIQELLLNYQELALLDIDTSQKADEYFTNLTNELKTFDNETKLKLIEKMLPDLNTAIWAHSKFHPNDTPEKYKKRWKELVNSLKARLIGYKETLKEDDIKEYKELSKALKKYVNIDAETLKYIIKYKELPPQEKENKPRWEGKYFDAILFKKTAKMTYEQFNSCFSLPKPLHSKHISKPQYKKQDDYDIFKKLEDHKHLF
jgi:hypothetical protein